MTLKELKSLANELQVIKNEKKEILFNNNLSNNQKTEKIANLQPKIDELEAIIEKYNSIFTVKAYLVTEEIVKQLQADEPTIKVRPIFELNQQIQNESSYFDGIATVSISLQKQNARPSRHDLLTTNIKTNEWKFSTGDFDINIASIILNDTLPMHQSIEQACWNAISKKLGASSVKANNSARKNLLLERLNILQDEKLREREIQKITMELSNMERESFESKEESNDISIDHYSN